MTLQEFNDQTVGTEGRRGRGPTRPFPIVPLSDSLSLPVSILQYGMNGRIQRLTLLEKLDQTNEYNLTRDLITSSSKYGMTTGSYAAPVLQVTDDGRALVELEKSSRGSKEKLFDHGISRIGPFEQLYQKLRDRPLPDISVLKDAIIDFGVSPRDSQKAAQVFVDNLRFLGLVVDIQGRSHVHSIEAVLDQLPLVGKNSTDIYEDKHNLVDDAPIAEVLKEGPQTLESPRSETVSRPDLQNEAPPDIPPLHIDIQIHIDSTASAEQIDRIFASMARHLYRREG